MGVKLGSLTPRAYILVCLRTKCGGEYLDIKRTANRRWRKFHDE
jgi:hypothetical protein